MVAYSIFLNFVEVFNYLPHFVYLYYSFSSRKQFCLLLASLFLICELCDIFKRKWNCINVRIFYHRLFVYYIRNKKKCTILAISFILGGYVIFIIYYIHLHILLFIWKTSIKYVDMQFIYLYL